MGLTLYPGHHQLCCDWHPHPWSPFFGLRAGFGVGNLLHFGSFTSSSLQPPHPSPFGSLAFHKTLTRCTFKFSSELGVTDKFFCGCEAWLWWGFFFMAPNLQTKGVKRGCKVIWGQRESLEVMKYPSFNSQFWLQTIWTIPEEVFEKIYIKCLQPDSHKLHRCRYRIHSIQGQGGEFIFQADMQGLLMMLLWPRQMAEHASGVSLFEMGKRYNRIIFIASTYSWHWILFIVKQKTVKLSLVI